MRGYTSQYIDSILIFSSIQLILEFFTRNMARQRITREIQDLQKDGEFNVRWIDQSEDTLGATVHGPPQSPFSNGVFEIVLRLTPDYPLAPPTVSFQTKIFHPNVEFKSGDVCLDILKSDWSPAWGIGTVCRAIVALLASPNAESPLNCDAGNLLRSGDTLGFESLARMYTIEHAIRSSS
jgi:peroxin-4